MTGPRHASDSQEQRLAETALVAAFAADLGRPLAPRTITTAGGTRVELDAATDDLDVLVEVSARFGPPRGAQPKKILADALKLSWVAGQLRAQPARLVLLFADRAAAGPFLPTARRWGARAIADAGIEVMVCELEADLRAQVEAAQVRQYR